MIIIENYALLLTTKFNNNNINYEKIKILELFNNDVLKLELLYFEILNNNIEYPDIVFAQAVLESGYMKSKIFYENNNLFGMREAHQRITTAKGTENNHAYYHTWYESVLDYSFYQCKYLSNITTEELYFDYLSQSYAENPNYVSILKDMINRENLKMRFGSSK